MCIRDSVGKVALGANDAHTVKVFQEAEAYEGPSIIIAYCHCIAHGIDTVSYTHLDVYKRQPLRDSGNSEQKIADVGGIS